MKWPYLLFSHIIAEIFLRLLATYVFHDEARQKKNRGTLKLVMHLYYLEVQYLDINEAYKSIR